MNRAISITLAALLVVTTVAVPIAAASVVSSTTVQDGSEANDGAESIKPGERFAAAVGVQHAELEGDVSTRAIGVRLANAETDAAKAAIIDDHLETSRTRLADLEARLEGLNESREVGEISDGRYRAEVATTVAEMRTVERQAAVVETTAAEIPEQVLADHDIDVASIRTLRERASDLGGPDTAAIARSIAGEDVGRSIGDNTDSREPSEQGSDTEADGRADGQPGSDDPASER